jgi:hypothetical protein
VVITIRTSAPIDDIPITATLRLWDDDPNPPEQEMHNDELHSTPEDPWEWNRDSVMTAQLGDGIDGEWVEGKRREWIVTFDPRYLRTARLEFWRHTAPFGGTAWFLHLDALIRRATHWVPDPQLPHDRPKDPAAWPGSGGGWWQLDIP